MGYGLGPVVVELGAEVRIAMSAAVTEFLGEPLLLRAE
jgi:hypothetical protein